jgi:hypothetical protein
MNQSPIVVPLITSRTSLGYFDNDKVEDLLVRYVQGNCTSISLRDEIMAHAGEFVRQLILGQGLHRIAPRHVDEADLWTIGWIQIEKTLYKYKARPHCADCYDPGSYVGSVLYDPDVFEYGIITPEEIAERGLRCRICGKTPSRVMYRGIARLFSLWSQIARNSILAECKRLNRDGLHRWKYIGVLGGECGSVDYYGLLDEAEELFADDELSLTLLKELHNIVGSGCGPQSIAVKLRLVARGCGVMKANARVVVDEFLERLKGIGGGGEVVSRVVFFRV